MPGYRLTSITARKYIAAIPYESHKLSLPLVSLIGFLRFIWPPSLPAWRLTPGRASLIKVSRDMTFLSGEIFMLSRCRVCQRGRNKRVERDRFGSTARELLADREKSTHRVDVYSGRSFGIEVSLLLEQSTVAPLHVQGAGQAPGRTHSPALFVSSSSSPADKVPE